MSDVPFHATRMGRTYYEHQLPELLRQVTRLGDAVGRLVELYESKDPAAKPATTQMEDQDGLDPHDPQETNPPHPRADDRRQGS